MKRFIASSVLLALVVVVSQAKVTIVGQQGDQLNAIQTAVPFLTISPDSRGASLGDAGVATSPDIYSQHWNASKYPFLESDMGLSLSYVPWLRNLGINDINLFYLTGYKKFGIQALSASLRYFTLGDIQFTDIWGQPIKTANPNEFAIDVAYSRLLSKNFSASVLFRYVRSDLAQGVDIGTPSYAGNAFASDISCYYQKNIKLSRKDGVYSFGLNISNMGNKIQYNDNDRSFLPINMKIGNAMLIDLDDYNSLTFTLDFNKLLAPTPPLKDSSGNVIGMGDYDAAVPVAMLRSFYDAPGILMSDGSRSVLLEELYEINICAGLEYWYAKQFAGRLGYFYETKSKGGRSYLTLGCGLRLNVFGLDVSYLVSRATSPLANTFRFSLQFNMDEKASKKSKNRFK
jgi:hypothetical protein